MAQIRLIKSTNNWKKHNICKFPSILVRPLSKFTHLNQ